MKDAFRKTPWPVILVILSFIFPTELSLVIGDLRLSPHRVAFLVLLPFALTRLVLRPDCRLKLYDLPFVALAIWQTAIFTWHAGNAGLAFGGSWALEGLGGYAIARAYVRDLDTLRASMRFVFFSIIVAAAIAFLDTLTARYFTHDLLRASLGGDPMPPMELRKGLARAAGTFDHPIHYGTYCATMFALIWLSEPARTWRYLRAAGMGIAAFLAMSSAPLLSLGLQGLMLTWDHFTKGFNLRAHLTLAIMVGLYIGVLAVSNRPPVQLLITGATFDPWTGLYRMMIWEHGLTNIWASPWTGLGLADWERPNWMFSSTIDAYWLVLPMRSGIPAFLFLALGIILLARGVIVRGTRMRDALHRRASMGWMISLIAFCLLGATVHFWNVPHALFYFFLGLGGALANPRAAMAASPAAARSAVAARRPVHPSFIRPYGGAMPLPA